MARTTKPKEDGAVILVDPAKLVPYENNPRVNEEAVEYLVGAIKAAAGPGEPLEAGFKDPIEVNEDMVILCGHTRQKAALKLGLKYVKVIVQHFPTKEAENLYRLTNNKSSEYGYWDQSKLDIELEPLAPLFDLEELGFFQGTEEEEEYEEPEESEDAPVAEEKKEYVIVVTCATEMARDEAYTELVNSGYICRKI